MKRIRSLGTVFAMVVTATLAACGGGGGGGGGSTTHRLDVAVTGGGSVTSQPSGINCGSTCNATFAANVSVTLTATAASGNSFSAWGGVCAGTTATTCTVQMNAAKSATAAFVSNTGTTHALNVTVTGNGAVSSQPAGIDCGTTCSATFAQGALVTLTATPTSGNQFSSWGGACSGTTATCAVQMNAAASATATFAPTPPPTGAWSGAVPVRSLGGQFANDLQVAISANGDAIAVWLENDTGVGISSVWASRYAAATNAWGTATLLETGGSTAFEPQVAMDPNGNATVVWMQQAGIHMNAWAARFQVGSGWQAAVLLENENSAVNAGFTQSDVAMDAAGNAIAVWSQRLGVQSFIWSNRYTVGQGWGTAVSIDHADVSGQIDFSFDPRIGMDGNGNAIVVWTDGSNLIGNRYSGGAWGATPVPVGTGRLARHDLAVNAAGNAVVVIAGRVNSSTQTEARAWTYTVAGGWNPTVTVLDAGRIDSVDSPPKVAMDAAGNAIAVWNQLDANGRYSAFANRYVAGTGWAAAPVLVESNESDNSRFGVEIGMDDAGNALAAWQSQHPSNSPTNNWVSPLAVGSNSWAAPTKLQAGTQDPTTPRFAVNAGGRAIAVWFQQNDAATEAFLMANYLR